MITKKEILKLFDFRGYLESLDINPVIIDKYDEIVIKELIK